MSIEKGSAGGADLDRELVNRVLKGDGDAFAVLVERYQRLLMSLALGILRDDAKAEDAVQEAFVAAWRSLRGFQGRASFRNWLCRILVNHACSRARWDGLRRWLRLDAPSESESRLVAGLTDNAAEADPEAANLRTEHGRAVREAVAALPLQQRTAVLLRSEGLEVTDVAEAMGVAEGTVKAHLHGARAKLEKILGAA